VRAAAFASAMFMAACFGPKPPAEHAVRGVVVDVNSPTQIVVDHEAIPGVMAAMTMPFSVPEGSLPEGGVRPGDVIEGVLVMDQRRSFLHQVKVTGHQEVAASTEAGVAPLRAGDVLAPMAIPVTGDTVWTVGEGQGIGTAVAFLYTTCPLPEFCPAVVTRLQGLQETVRGKARLLAVTIDPKGDTLEVLTGFAEGVGAYPDTWRFGRVEGEAFHQLTGKAALAHAPGKDEVIHGLRLLVLDADGRLVERYDDNAWPEARVAQQLLTGGPMAPAGSDGTVYRKAPQ